MTPPPELMKVICDSCKHSIHKCICPGPKKANARQVRVFTEDAVREGFEKLDAGEALSALDYFSDLLGDRHRRPIMRRI